MNEGSPKFFLGVDGGNTKTIALISSADGRIVGAGRGGCADIYGSEDAALASIDAAIAAALTSANLGASAIGAAAFSLAGADWPEDFAFLESSLARYAPKITVFNDAIGAIIAGAPEGWGASAVCGTGGTSGARSPEGKTWHGGFWHDSSCGGEALGQAAIAAVLRAELKIDPATRLTDLLLEHYGQASVEAMLHAHTRRVNRVSRNAAGLARLVLDAAAEGDAAARAIVETQAASAAEHVIVASREVGILERPFPLVLAGGVFRHPSKLLETTLLKHVRRRAPQAEAIRTNIEPAAGALLAAIQLGGEHVTDDLRSRLHETHPPQSLFET
jgi:N-acetylglucosamine kinase-like BadF-type ATPase